MSPATPHRRRDDVRLATDLQLFHVYRLLSTSYLFLPVLITFFVSRGLDFTHIALLNSVYALTAIVFEVPTGALADRFGRCRAMMLGSLLMAIGCVVDFNGHDFWSFALGEGLLALGMTLTSGADSAYLYDLLLSYGREHEYRSHEGSATAAKLIGAAAALVAGGFVGRAAPAMTYAATACVCASAALVAMMMREPPIVRDDDSDFLHGMAHAARAVVTRPPLLFAVGFSVLLFTLLRQAQNYLYQPYLNGAGVGTVGVGIILAVLSMIGAVGAKRIEAVRRRLGETGLVWGLPLAMAVSFVLMGRYVAVWGVALLAVQSLVNGIYSPFSKELLNREIADSGQRATVLSVESMARRLAFGAFAPVAGVLIDAHGLPAAMYLCAGAGFVGASLLIASAIRRRRRGLVDFAGEVTPTPLPLPADDSQPISASMHH
ncbi:MAG TPA: MFS transporter [Polyangia bacterium]|nr:MFS transporter [Polyangia bacterium]